MRRDVVTLRGITPFKARFSTREIRQRGPLFTSIRRGLAAPSPQAVPFGIVEDDGGFSLTCDGVGNGCPPGQYAVLVEWRDGAGDGIVPVKTNGKTKLVKRSRVRSGPDRLDGRYFNISKPLLHVEVLPQSNSLDPFELGG